MTVNFKYNIGDMVTLIKLPDYLNLSSNYYKVEFRPKQYKIDGYKFVIALPINVITKISPGCGKFPSNPCKFARIA